MSANWLSGYVFARDGDLSLCDELILALVDPVVARARAEGWIQSFFFIRYWENGAHVRLRLATLNSAESYVQECVERVVEGLPRSFIGVPVGEVPSSTYVSRHESLAWIPYSPETERYGGKLAVQVAEDFFEASSEAALQLLVGIRDARLDRLGSALAIMVVTLAEFTQFAIEESAEIARVHQLTFADAVPPKTVHGIDQRYRDQYDRQSRKLSSIIHSCWIAAKNGTLPPPLNIFASRAATTRARLIDLGLENALFAGSGVSLPVSHALRQLLPSYMHMTNNRLGVNRRTEAFLGHAISRALTEPRIPE